MKKYSIALAVLAFLFTSQVIFAQSYRFDDSWGKQGITLLDNKQSGVQLNYSITDFQINTLNLKGEDLKTIHLPEVFLPNDEGAPDLPGFSKMIAIPQGATAKIKITSSRSETFTNINIAPAPRIPAETEEGPLHYEKNLEIFSNNEFYPANPIQLSEPNKIRGVDIVMLGITPFQYNPVTKELIMFRDIKLEIEFTGGNGQFGDDRLRSRWWDPILYDNILNANMLPEIDFNQKKGSQKTPDYEYVIIIPNDASFIQWADSIKNWRMLQGIETGVVTTTEIGGNTVSAIETYVNNAYNNWDVPPAAVLLLGDYGTSGSTINSQYYTHPAGYPDFVSDNRFADVTGNELPDIAFARITANNASQLQVMVSKFLNYERNPPSSYDFYDHPITALGWQTERWFQICSEAVGGYFKNVQGKNPVRINAIYSGTPGSTWSTATNTSSVTNYFGPSGLGYIPATPSELGGWSGGTASDVVNAINSGSFMLQHRDHGYYQGWGEPDFSSSNINSLTNVNNQLPYILSINCQTGAFHYSSETFTEKFHRYTYGGQNSGALGVLAATEVSYSFVNDTYLWGVMDNMFPDFMGYTSTFPVNYVMPAFGNAAGKYFLYSSSWPYNTGDKLITYRLFHHHGDAFMTVYTEVPQYLSVTHSPTLLSGSSSFSVTANSGSMIALTVDGEIIGTADGTGSPVAISIPSLNPGDEIVVTVTKQNFYRYSGTASVLPPTGPYVSYTSHTINDATGNNNGLADFGENILLNMTLENSGSSAAYNVHAILSSSDPYVSITDNSADFGTINNGSNSTLNNAFALTIASDIPDQYSLNFELQIVGDTDDIWTSNFSIIANAPSFTLGSMTIDDATGGNGNGKLDPGETANISIETSNDGNSNSNFAVVSLSSSSSYITVNTSTQNFPGIGAGSTVYPSFSISVNGSTPIGTNVVFNANVTSGSYSDASAYNAIVGQIPVLIVDLDPSAGSATAMGTAMTNLGVPYDLATSFPSELDIYSSVFVCLGIYSNNHTLTSTEGTTLAGYLNAGGSLYMEGGDTWAYDASTTVHGMFNIIGEADGTGDMGTVIGMAGSFTSGMSFTYSGENNYMDQLGATSPAYVILQNQSPSYGTAVAYDAGTYKTIGASHEFGGLDDGTSPSTKMELMEEYLTFFGILSSSTFPQISVNPSSLNFGSIEVGNSTTLQFTIENTGTGVLSGSITTPAGFTVASAKSSGDNTLNYAVNQGMTEPFDLTFTPVAAQYYSGDVTINHNAGGAAEIIAVNGTGLPAPTPDILIDPSSLYVTVMQDNTKDEFITISNTGNANLSYSTLVNYSSKFQEIKSELILGKVYKNSKKSKKQEEAPYKVSGTNAIDAIGDILMDLDIETPTGDNQLLGGEFDGIYLWFTGGGSSGDNQLYKLDTDGNLISTYSQNTTSDWGIRDLAFDGTYLYGGDENGFYRITPSTGTVTTLFTGNLGLGCIRAVAYNSVNGHFYAANWDSQIIEFNTSGTTLATLATPGLTTMYGLAYDESTDNLWIFDRTGSPSTSFYEYNISGQTLSGTVIQVPMLSGLTDQMNGGAFYSTNLIQNKICLGGVVQGTDIDKFFAIELGDLVSYSWLSITNNGSGNVSAGSSSDVTTHFDATGMNPGIYTGEVLITSNDPDEPQIAVPCTMEVVSGLQISLTAILEGPFVSTQMFSTLNSFGFLPLSQPYNIEPWNYNGTESVSLIPNDDVIDWVLVEIRETPGDVTTATPATTVAKQAGFILKNGSIVSTDGSSPLMFDFTPVDNLYAIVYHRNHLGIMSAYPIIDLGSGYEFDFSSSEGQVYGGAHAHKQVELGKWGMAAGDANGDGEIDNKDKNNFWELQAGQLGYLEGDFDLNSQVEMTDKIIKWESNSGKCSNIIK